MSNSIIQFGHNALSLSYDLDGRLTQWSDLRLKMVRGVPAEFTRDEWAYLITFLEPEHLNSLFSQTFGPRQSGTTRSLFHSKGPTAIWLPSNVSLLGPLALILASFSGASLRVKTGSRSDDLCAAFVSYALENLSEGELKHYLGNCVTIERFDRSDPRNADMAAWASIRIAFGSDAAMSAIHALPHPPESIGISFGDHCSEAWIKPGTFTDDDVNTLLKVFAIYGQAGCTSPRRAVLLNGTMKDAQLLRDRFLAAWPSAFKRDTPMHIASQNILQSQINTAAGWDVLMAPRHAAVFAIGNTALPPVSGLMSLAIVPATLAETVASLPSNIQTIGHSVSDPCALLDLLAQTPVKRFVPLGRMHHFGPVWDGQNFWRLLFTEVSVGL